MNVDKLITLVRTEPRAKNIIKAQDFLEDNPDHDLSQELFKALIECAKGDQFIDWSIAWITASSSRYYPYLSILVQNVPERQEELLALALKFIENNPKCEQAIRLGADLIAHEKYIRLIPWAKNYLLEDPSSIEAGRLIYSLLVSSPDDLVIQQARVWYSVNRDDWWSNFVLSGLIPHSPSSDLIEDAYKRFADDPVMFSMLAYSLLLGNEESQSLIAEWVESNFNSVLFDYILFEGLTKARQIFVNSIARMLLIRGESEEFVESIFDIITRRIDGDYQHKLKMASNLVAERKSGRVNKSNYKEHPLLMWVKANYSHPLVITALSASLGLISKTKAHDISKTYAENGDLAALNLVSILNDDKL